jgi:hypothetical protein
MQERLEEAHMNEKAMKFTRIRIAKPDIIESFNALHQNVMKRSDIERLLAENREHWRLSESTTAYDFIKYMIGKSRLDAVRFQFPSRTVVRYIWGEPSTYKLALSLTLDAYFCHYTAMHLHGLTEQIPKTIYLNSEQSPKPQRDTTLDQKRIEIAFKRKPRVSKNIAAYEDLNICILNGKYSKKLGVVDIQTPEGELVPVTGIERTLIDITVRPFYSGGVFEVLKAFRLAQGKVSINKLTAMLQKLNYLYPYHQAIGFYLEKSGAYKESLINLFRKFEINYDFYLTYGMKDMDYSKRWRLFFPKGL